MVPGSGITSFDLMVAADAALYAAKHRGRDRVEVKGCETMLALAIEAGRSPPCLIA